MAHPRTLALIAALAGVFCPRMYDRVVSKEILAVVHLPNLRVEQER
jgi:hypothetical protein